MASIVEKNCNNCRSNFECSDKRRKFCSVKCYNENRTGEGHWNWKRGWNLSAFGYVEVRVGVRKRQYQHRLVMEQHLGRKLTSDEQVHHANGDKTDNRIENLVLMTRSEHQTLHLRKRYNHG